MILMGPTGSIIKGHVLDVNKKSFTEALRAYDPLLYVKWNPRKLGRHGCWEIRRKPECTTAVDYTEYEGITIFKVDYQEYDLINHVLDCAFLNYDQLRKIKSIDTFAVGPKNWLDNLDRSEATVKAAREEAALKARSYASKHFKAEIGAFKEHVLSGGNPHLIGALWDSVKESE